MIFKGTEKMKRYPFIEGSDLMGIESYGTKRMKDGSRAYKADPNAKGRLSEAGWVEVGRGHSYMYVQYVESLDQISRDLQA